MKKYVSSEEINKLNKLQKENLRKLWEPVKYQLVIVPVCKNIENKFYEHKIYVIQDIIVCDRSKSLLANFVGLPRRKSRWF